MITVSGGDRLTQQKESIQRALQYIEKNLSEELNVREIAEQAHLSPYHFQRVFAAICGISLGEYIRGRRMTVSGDAVCHTRQKIIDIAAACGYASQDGFQRAFLRFHGISPTAARQTGALLRRMEIPDLRDPPSQYLPSYRIEEQEAFCVRGYAYRCHISTSHQIIPQIWDRFFTNKASSIHGMYGICIDIDGEAFEYLIADPCGKKDPAGDGTVMREIPASIWAVFPCTLSTLQDTTTRMWRDWLPGNGRYRLGAALNIERYFPQTSQDTDTDCEIWLPVQKNK